MPGKTSSYTISDLEFLAKRIEIGSSLDSSSIAQTEDYFYWIWDRSRLAYYLVPTLLGRTVSRAEVLKRRLKTVIWSFIGPLPHLQPAPMLPEIEHLILSWMQESELEQVLKGEDRYLGSLNSADQIHKVYIVDETFSQCQRVIEAGISIIQLKRNYFKSAITSTKLLWRAFLSILKGKSPKSFFCLDYAQGLSIERNFTDLLKSRSVKNLLIAYEAHPFQHSLLRHAKESGVKNTWGYIHSSIHAFPAFMIKRPFSPDFLLSHGTETSRVLVDLCGWNEREIYTTKSFRYSRKPRESFVNKIFLPYSFDNDQSILEGLSVLFEKIGRPEKSIEIRIHPDFKTDPRHLNLANKISTLIEKFSSNMAHIEDLSIFVNTTSTVLEAMENGIENVFHISENPARDFFTQEIWPTLKVENLSPYLRRYNLLKKGSFIRYLEPDENIDILGCIDDCHST